MPLAELFSKMQGDMPEKDKKKIKPINEAIDDTLPSSESLQSAKASRRDTATKVTDYFANKGYPTVGAVAGAATDLTADLIPESREDYKEQMVSSMSPAGSIGKVGTVAKLASKEAAPTLSSIPQAIRQRLMASGEELAAFNAAPREYMEKITQAARESRDAAQKAIDLKKGIGISKNAKPLEEPLQFEGTQSKETRRLMDPSKKFETTQRVVNTESGALPKASELAKKPEQVITKPEFQEYIGPTHKDMPRIREEESRAAALRRLRNK